MDTRPFRGTLPPALGPLAAHTIQARGLPSETVARSLCLLVEVPCVTELDSSAHCQPVGILDLDERARR